MPFPLAQHSIPLWLIVLMAINNFLGFSLNTGKGLSLFFMPIFPPAHSPAPALVAELESCSNFPCLSFALLAARATGTSTFITSSSLWETRDTQPTLVSTWTYLVPPATAEDQDAQVHIALP